MKIIQSPSPNFSATSHIKIGVQIHKTLGLMPWTLGWLQNPDASASAHYLVTKKGVIHQLVNLKDRSWSSGAISQPSKRGLKMMQSVGMTVKPGEYLIQVEVECLEHETYTEMQYESIVWLFKQFDFVVDDWNFLTHQDTAIYKPHLEKERLKILQRLNSKAYMKLQLLTQAITLIQTLISIRKRLGL